MRSASRRDAIQRAKQEKNRRDEESAIQSFACEMTTHPRVSNLRLENFSHEMRKHLILQSVPTPYNVTERSQEVEKLTDLATRASPLDSDPIAFAPSIDGSNANSDDNEEGFDADAGMDASTRLPIVYARSTYKGRHIHGDELESMSPMQRFSNLVSIDGLWVLPSSGEYGNYVIDCTTYGERKGLDSELQSVRKAFDDARNCTNDIISMLFTMKAFGDHPDMNNTAAMASTTCIKTSDGAYSTIRMILDDANPFCRNGQDALNEFKEKILKRWTLLNHGIRINNRIQRVVSQYRSNANSQGAGICDVFSCADVLRFLCSCMPSHCISKLLQTCKWDADVRSELHSMLPGIAIYTLKGGHFPHVHSTMKSIAVVHRDAMIKIAIGFRRLKYKFDLDKEDESNEVHTFDAAYTVLGSKNNQSVTTFDTACSSEVQEMAIPFNDYFQTPPDIKVSLVDAETGELFDSSCPMGGLVVDRSMRKYVGRNIHARLWFNNNFERWTRNKPNVKLAILFQFSLKNCIINARPLKIRAIVFGNDRLGRPLQMTAFSEHFLLRANKASAEHMHAKKRRKR